MEKISKEAFKPVEKLINKSTTSSRNQATNCNITNQVVKPTPVYTTKPPVSEIKLPTNLDKKRTLYGQMKLPYFQEKAGGKIK